MAKYHVAYEPKPGKIIALMFKTAESRQAFLRSNPGKATLLKASSAPKKVVVNTRTGAAS